MSDIDMSVKEALGEQFISLSGIIGGGKSTLATALAQLLNVPVYHESAQDSPILPKFYADQQKYAFQLQFDLLQRRVKQQQKIAWSGHGGVQDRTIYEDTVFVRMLHKQGKLSTEEVQIYHEHFDLHVRNMIRPNVIVHLDVSPEEAHRRIVERNRQMEQHIPLQYLQDLSDAYEEFLNRIHHTVPVIRLDWNTFQKPEVVAECIAKAVADQYHITEIVFAK